MKTYCLSDIHGHLNELQKFTKTLSKDDVVYVLGDAVDKGPDSIKTLQFIMKDKKFHMILGNHDYMMYRYLTAENDYVKEQYSIQWLDLNQGNLTLKEFNNLKQDSKDKIIDYLSNLPLSYEITVNNRNFLLAHADPFANKKLKASDKSDEVENSLWTRVFDYERVYHKDKIVIIGHTPVQTIFDDFKAKPYYYPMRIDKASIIVIDGGLAAKELIDGKLIVFCLDDLSYETY